MFSKKLLAIGMVWSSAYADDFHHARENPCKSNSDVLNAAKEYMEIARRLRERTDDIEIRATLKREDGFVRNLFGKFNMMSQTEMDSDVATAMTDMCMEMMDSTRVNIRRIQRMDSGPMRALTISKCPHGSCNIPFYLRNIWQYGCWCNFDSDLLTGSGHPQDKFDEVCKNLQLCLRCAKMDGLADNYSCDPVTKDYNVAIDTNWGPGFGQQSFCNMFNQNDDCAIHCCACDSQFIGDLLNMLMIGSGGTGPNPALRHDGGFDNDQVCREDNPISRQLSCCGYYPFRFPYNENRMGCCDNGVSKSETYNTMTQTCCTGGDVKGIGTC